MNRTPPTDLATKGRKERKQDFLCDLCVLSRPFSFFFAHA